MITFILLVWITYYDLRERRIPILSICIGVIYWIFRECFYMIKDHMSLRMCIPDLIAALCLCGVCFLIRMIEKESIGLGDILLLGIFTLLAGYIRMVESLIVAFSLFILCSLFFLCLGYSRKTTLPFAPFLLLGYGGALFIRFLGIG